MRTTKFLLPQIVSLLLLAGSRPCAQASRVLGIRRERQAEPTVGVGEPEAADTRCRSETRGVRHRQTSRP